MKNKFLLFIGAQYYPQGGVDDLFGVYQNREDAVKALNTYLQEQKDCKALIGDFWAQVYDVENNKTVWKETIIPSLDGSKFERVIESDHFVI